MKESIDLIFDTDAGSDCDDMMALAYLIYAQRQGYVRLRAITYSNGVPDGPGAVRALFRHLGEVPPPIGTPTVDLKPHDNYCKAVVERFGTPEDKVTTESAVRLLRRTLAESDGAVICAVGAMTNIGALLVSVPDDISPLDGVALVREKCTKMVLMAGIFDPTQKRVEWNIHLDVPAAQNIAKLCPVPLFWLPSETGIGVMTGGPIMERYGEDTPLSLSFTLFPGVKKRGGRPSWDPLTALWTAEGCRDLLTESPCGTVTVQNSGETTFVEKPDGLHRILTLADEGAAKRAAAYIDTCALQVHAQSSSEH